MSPRVGIAPQLDRSAPPRARPEHVFGLRRTRERTRVLRRLRSSVSQRAERRRRRARVHGRSLRAAACRTPSGASNSRATRSSLVPSPVSLVPVLEELQLEPADAWVPVPLHRSRLVERGFNQSALLARILAKSTGSRFAPRTLERRRETEQQARLGRAARAHNAFGAFAVRRPVAAERVVLVDDVVTTGATARACLAALREANVAVLAVVALAQAPG